MTQPAYTVIGAASTRALRPMWMLEELGLPYEHTSTKPHAEAVTRHYPRGKVPVLLVGDQPITDSTAIIQYLADAHGAHTYAAGTLERARQDAMTHCLLDEFDAVLWAAARHSFILPEERRVAGVKESLKWEFERNQANFVKRMGEGPFVMGERFTVPDIILSHCLMWAKSAKFDITEPALEAYQARIRSRPALAAAIQRGKAAA